MEPSFSTETLACDFDKHRYLELSGPLQIDTGLGTDLNLSLDLANNVHHLFSLLALTEKWGQMLDVITAWGRASVLVTSHNYLIDNRRPVVIECVIDISHY